MHSWRTGHTVAVACLPPLGALTHVASLLHWTAVRDELGDLPVHPVCRADVSGRAGGELLIEYMALSTHRGALSAMALVQASHLSIRNGRNCVALGRD